MTTYAPTYETTSRTSRILQRVASARTGRRMFAFIIDVLVYGALTSFLTIIFNFIGTTAASLLYASLHDCTLGPGRSLGRAAMGHRLMMNDGRDATYLTAILRNAIRWLLWSTVLLFFVDLVLLFLGEGRILSDFIVGTRVCEDPNGDGQVRREVVRERRESHGVGYGAGATGRFDPDLAEAHEELDFHSPHHAYKELNRFEEKLTNEHEPVVVEEKYR